MKKYILFTYENYYPAGGMNDIEDSFDTIDEAVAKVEKLQEDYTAEFYQIVDRDTWQIVKDGDPVK